jgi:Flp pilus assembly protein CpaB
MRRIFLILGIVLGLLVAIGTFLFIQAQRPQEVTVPIANEDIPAGTVLRRELFSGVKMANVPATTYQKWVLATEFAEQAEGRTATSDIKAGFPIAKASLDPNSEGGIETRLSLAITGTNDYYIVIPATPDQVGNFVQPGDRVDLIVSIGDANRQEGLTMPLTPTLETDENGLITVTTPFPISKLVMQNMKVIRVEREAARQQNNQQTQQALNRTVAAEVRDIKRLYVKVDRDQLEVLSFVLNNGKRNIAVRSADGSTASLPTDGVTWEDFVRWFYAQRNNLPNGAEPFRSISPYATPAASEGQ